MNTNFFKTAAILTMVFMGLTSCSPTEKTSDNEEIYKGIVESYVDNVVVATYSNLATEAIKLHSLCEDFKGNLSDQKVTDACNKWKDARAFWEKSEAFLFGPADYSSLDPHIDSWPLDKDKLDQVLGQPDIMTMDGAYARTNFGASLVGFHAVEYILFRDGAARKAADITQKEIIYLIAVTQVLAEDCILLEGNWIGYDLLSADKKEYVDNAELSLSGTFGREMKNAGGNGSRYTSIQQAVYEILEGCIAIADEVGNSKIADPISTGNVLEVESWYSWNSIADFVDNINSIENSYLGSVSGEVENSLSNFVNKTKPDLDKEIKANITSAKQKIIAIGQPFRNNLNNKQGAQEAMDACSNLELSFQKINDIIK